MSVVKHSFIDSELYAGNRQITADGGKICLYSVNPTQTLILSNMYHVPNLSVNLISVDIIHSDVWGMVPLLAD